MSMKNEIMPIVYTLNTRYMLSRLQLWSQRHMPQQFMLRLSSAFNAVLPSSCALCGATANEALCPDCRTQFFAPRQHACRQCALEQRVVSLAHAVEPALEAVLPAL